MPYELKNWPQDDAGRYVCNRSKPRPPGATGRWTHQDDIDDRGMTPDGHGFVIGCGVCGATWTQWYNSDGED